MKILSTILGLMLCASAALGANVPFTAFRGVGGIQITTNVSLGTVTIDGSGITAGALPSYSLTNNQTTPVNLVSHFRVAGIFTNVQHAVFLGRMTNASDYVVLQGNNNPTLQITSIVLPQTSFMNSQGVGTLVGGGQPYFQMSPEGTLMMRFTTTNLQPVGTIGLGEAGTPFASANITDLKGTFITATTYITNTGWMRNAGPFTNLGIVVFPNLTVSRVVFNNGSGFLTNVTSAAASTDVVFADGSTGTAGSNSITASAINTTKILDGTIGAADYADNSIAGTKIALGSDAQGDVMYYNGTDWVRLGAGTTGHFLQTQGAGANPQWAAASGSGTPGGNSGAIQFTEGALFAGTNRLVYDRTNNVVTLQGETSPSSLYPTFAVTDNSFPATVQYSARWLSSSYTAFSIGVGGSHNAALQWTFTSGGLISPATGNPSPQIGSGDVNTFLSNSIAKLPRSWPSVLSGGTIRGTNSLWTTNVATGNNVTFSISSPITDQEYEVQGTNGTGTFTWPAEWKWPDGATLTDAPTFQNQRFSFVVKVSGDTNAWVKYGRRYTLAVAGPSLALHTNDTTGVITVSNALSLATQVVVGAGNGNTNYTINISTNSINDFYIGSSNISITAVMGGVASVPIYWNIYATNLSAINWGIRVSSVTNRWRWSGVYGTNEPTVFTNNTCLMLAGRTDGTNTTVGYTFFSPGL